MKVELSEDEIKKIIEYISPHRGDYTTCQCCHRTLEGAYVPVLPHKRGCIVLKLKRKLNLSEE